MFQSVRENARRISCASNMKQLRLAVTQYTQDSDELMPSFDCDGAGNRQIASLGGWIYYSGLVAPTTCYLIPHRAAFIHLSKSTGNFMSARMILRGRLAGIPMRLAPALRRSAAITARAGQIYPGKNLSAFDNPSGTLLFGEEASSTVQRQHNQ